MNVHTNLKFVALSVHEIIGGTQKNLCSPWTWPCFLFFQIFNGLLFGWTLWMYRPNLQSVALPVPEITAIAVLGWDCETRLPYGFPFPILGVRKPTQNCNRYSGTIYRLQFGRCIHRVQTPIINLGEKGAWAYRGTAQIFWVPLIISGTGKATNFKFCTHIHRIDRNKSH